MKIRKLAEKRPRIHAEGRRVKRLPGERAGGKWRLSYVKFARLSCPMHKSAAILLDPFAVRRFRLKRRDFRSGLRGSSDRKLRDVSGIGHGETA